MGIVSERNKLYWPFFISVKVSDNFFANKNGKSYRKVQELRKAWGNCTIYKLVDFSLETNLFQRRPPLYHTAIAF